VSLRTDFPFGYYRFTDLMGPKLFDLPILLALAYVGMGYLSWVLAVVILDCQNEPLSGRKIVLLPLAASFVMTAWDFSMEAVWADIDHAWVWRDGGPYYGVPASNFFGWFLTVYIFYQLFALYLRNRVTIRSRTSHWRLAILFYAAFMPHVQRGTSWLWLPCLWAACSWMLQANTGPSPAFFGHLASFPSLS
jgi:uncharacterized membrane protein